MCVGFTSPVWNVGPVVASCLGKERYEDHTGIGIDKQVKIALHYRAAHPVKRIAWILLTRPNPATFWPTF